jgi:hypothetical protein
MLTTYYKTADPGALAQAEYYQLHTFSERHDGAPRWMLHEKHGWFDPSEKKAINAVKILGPEDRFSTLEEAEELLRTQLCYLASIGYVHAFSRDPLAYEGIHYEQVDPQNL